MDDEIKISLIHSGVAADCGDDFSSRGLPVLRNIRDVGRANLQSRCFRSGPSNLGEKGDRKGTAALEGLGLFFSVLAILNLFMILYYKYKANNIFKKRNRLGSELSIQFDSLKTFFSHSSNENNTINQLKDNVSEVTTIEKKIQIFSKNYD